MKPYHLRLLCFALAALVLSPLALHAQNRLKDKTEAAAPAADDWLYLDGATNGVRKLSPDYFSSGSGSGSMTTVKAAGTQVGGADIVTLDFGSLFSVTETPDTEINLTLNAALTLYGGISPSANVQTLLGAADYSAFRTSLGLVIGTNVQAYDADLTTYAGITPAANTQSLLGAANYAAMRALLDLEAGTDFLAYPTGTPTGSKYLRDDNTWQAIAGGGDALVANPLTQFTGILPTNTEFNYVDGVTSAIQGQLDAKQATITFGTGVQTALGVNVGSAGAPVLFNGAGGTPSSLTLTNATGLPVAGGGTGVSTLTAYAPLFGGTTGTGAVQSGTVGTAGQVLTSNGAGALPTFQAASSGSTSWGSTTGVTDTASATTTDLGAVTSAAIRITGTTTITGFGTVAAGTLRTVYFEGALTLTHNGTSLILPGAANITTAANDRLTALSLGSGNWIVTGYHKADGTPVAIGANLDYGTNPGEFSVGNSTITSGSTINTPHGYKWQVDGNDILQVYAESDGAGGIQNQGIKVNGGKLLTTLSAYGAGTAYAFTNTAAAVDLGTTDPSITFTTAGTWKITACVQLTYTGATVAAETATLKLRRTNNTAADLTSSTLTIDLPVSTTLTHTYGTVMLPPVYYTTVNANDVVTIFANVSAALGAGTIDAAAAGTWIVAERLY